MVLGSGLSLLNPLVVRWLIDVATQRDLRLVLLGTLVFCVVYLASVIVSYLSSFVSCIVTQKMVFRIRVSLLRRIQLYRAISRKLSGGRNALSESSKTWTAWRS